MSDQEPARPGGPKPRRSPFANFLMVLLGIILLLPGLCSIRFAAVILSNLDFGPLLLWVAGLLIAALGINLIVRGTSR
jgi:hypothetical protein